MGELGEATWPIEECSRLLIPDPWRHQSMGRQVPATLRSSAWFPQIACIILDRVNDEKTGCGRLRQHRDLALTVSRSGLVKD